MSKIYGVIPNDPVPDAPAVPVLDEATAGYVSLSWDAVPRATLYRLYKDGTPLGGPTANLYATDTAVVPSTAYSYQLQAFNASGGSALGAALDVTTLANSLPAWILADQSGTIGAAFSLGLEAVCEDVDGHSVTYTLVSGSVPGLSLASSTYSGSPTTAGAYPLTFRANDGYGTSDVSITFTVVDPDVTAPGVPTGVSASANGSTVTVSWTASTDATGVANYRIYRDGLFRSTATASPYTETGVPSGSYVYTVSAVDSSSNANESAQSSAAPVTVALATPDTPINFVAADNGGTTINLSWEPGPNGTQPDDYDLDFSTTSASGPWTSISIGLVTSYSHTGLTAGTTYYYRVRAGAAGAGSSGYATASDTVPTANSTLLTEDFSSATWYTKWHNPDRVKNSTTPFNYTSEPTASSTGSINRVAPSYKDTAEGIAQGYQPRTATSYAGRVTIPSGTHYGCVMSYFPYFPSGNPNTGGPANALSNFPSEMYLEYYLRLGTTWNPAQNGKLPGFRGGSRTTAKDGADGAGGSGCDGLHGWSARAGYVDPCSPVTGRTRYKAYVYHADQAGLYGENITGGITTYGSCSTGFAKNTWYKIKYYCKPNTSATSANGILRMWVNDVLVGESTTYRFDLTTGRDYPLTKVWMDIYHGGGTPAPQDLHLFLSDIRIWVP